jgi:hypothetical protein
VLAPRRLRAAAERRRHCSAELTAFLLEGDQDAHGRDADEDAAARRQRDGTLRARQALWSAIPTQKLNESGMVEFRWEPQNVDAS